MNMAKMTKAQARKRLEEAADKVAKVWGNQQPSKTGFTKRDSTDLVKVFDELIRLANKLK